MSSQDLAQGGWSGNRASKITHGASTASAHGERNVGAGGHRGNQRRGRGHAASTDVLVGRKVRNGLEELELADRSVCLSEWVALGRLRGGLDRDRQRQARARQAGRPRREEEVVALTVLEKAVTLAELA